MKHEHSIVEAPVKAEPCRLQGRMTPKGYEPENAAWLPILTYRDERLGNRADGSPRRAGHDPMKLPLDVLSASGHPRRGTGELIRALNNPNRLHAENADGDPIAALQEVRGYRDIPAYCDACSGSAHLRRKCATINCPFWAYRMGRNPHNPKRGIQPAFGPRQTPDTARNDAGR